MESNHRLKQKIKLLVIRHSGGGCPGKSGDDIVDDPAVDVCEAEVTAIVSEGEFLMVEAKEVEQSGMPVMHVDLILYGVVAKVVCLTE